MCIVLKKKLTFKTIVNFETQNINITFDLWLLNHDLMESIILFLFCLIFFISTTRAEKKINKNINSDFTESTLIKSSKNLNDTLIGVYITDLSIIKFIRNGKIVNGTFTNTEARIEGSLDGFTLSGTWYIGKDHGRLIFEFNMDFSSFKGKWNYNNLEPSATWNGKRREKK